RAGGSPSAQPTDALLGGQSFSVADSAGPTTSSGGDAGAYEGLSVVVAWTDAAGPHRVEQDSAVPGPSAQPVTTDAGCPAPVVAAAPSVASPTAGGPALDVAWTEPPLSTSVVPILRWGVETSPDGVTWTVSVTDEPVFPAGAAHAVEVGGLQPGDAYAARLLAYGACGAPGTSPVAVASTPTAASGGGGCDVGGVTLAAPVAPRAPDPVVPGSLANDVTIDATTASGCPDGLWAGVATSGTAISAVPLSAVASGWFAGTIDGTGQAWDLGPHLVEIFEGAPVAGPLPATPLASVEVCVVPAGASSC
ncbi:MAG TPA: hypothetical protein VGI06_03885, partial [Acidimicrobiales bacterium]